MDNKLFILGSEMNILKESANFTRFKKTFTKVLIGITINSKRKNKLINKYKI